MAGVAFKQGTASAYSKITPDSHTFYYTTDDDQVYLGSISLTSGLKAHHVTNYALSYLDGTFTNTYSSSTTAKQIHRLSRFIAIIAADQEICFDQWYLTRSSGGVVIHCSYHDLNLSASSPPTTATPIYVIYYDL